MDACILFRLDDEMLRCNTTAAIKNIIHLNFLPIAYTFRKAFFFFPHILQSNCRLCPLKSGMSPENCANVKNLFEWESLVNYFGSLSFSLIQCFKFWQSQYLNIIIPWLLINCLQVSKELGILNLYVNFICLFKNLCSSRYIVYLTKILI